VWISLNFKDALEATENVFFVDTPYTVELSLSKEQPLEGKFKTVFSWDDSTVPCSLLISALSGSRVVMERFITASAPGTTCEVIFPHLDGTGERIPCKLRIGLANSGTPYFFVEWDVLIGNIIPGDSRVSAPRRQIPDPVELPMV
jgi:hypothetical protein